MLIDKLRLLDELAAEIKVCPKCRLAETRTQAVPGEGSPTARIMFVGEGPGEKEDLSGRPFIGAAGQFLNSLLAKAEIDRKDVFIANVVKCRPPGNRDPLADEIEACNDYLMAQIAIIEPKIICPLGSPSLRTLLGPDLKISKVRCKVFRKNGILYIPLYHPAAALHRQELQTTLLQDIMVLKELINRDILEEEITDLTPRIGVECAPEKAPEAVQPEAIKAEPVKPAESQTLSLF
ncbi:MAG: uracil-DNA glycosylase [Abitibacteriaceae bacterium]|nr:uracil-DNA glycosylase [Abditibacteriaceae bacterium]